MKKILSIGLILISILMITGCDNSKKLDGVAYTSLRHTIAKSAYDGSGEISVNYLDKLKTTVKELSKDYDWFSDYSGTFYGLNKDTDNKKIDYICNKDYCAKLTAELRGATDYYLIDYSFEKNNEKGYIIHINK
ncbi:MAG: hypothetical protein HFI36_07560 [Bacilli bacterium]|jgi:hypothetical protein|nr:hypothetical protein [Bacilli bacterium]